MNNKLKKIVLTLVTCLSVSIVFAQENKASSEEACKVKAKEITADLKAKLSLNNEQEQKVLDLMTYSQLKLVSNPNADGQVGLYQNEKMNEILSPSQMQVWMRMEAAKKPSGEPKQD
ncbi:MAG: hypothetical protein ABI772_03640 [Bacteroidota bacterium]